MSLDKKELGALVQALSETNIELWHQEDKARCDNAAQVFQAKKNIDQLNQQRNDYIEKIDDFIIQHVSKKN